MNPVKTAGALGLLGLFLSGAALAASDYEPNWYGGVGLGLSRAKIHDQRIRDGFAGSGLTVDSIDDDESGLGFKVFAGRQFNPYFAIEGGYFNLGEFGYTAYTTPPGSVTGKIKLQGLNLDAVGILPLTEKFSALGRVGFTYTQSRDSFSSTGAATVGDPHPKKNDANFKVGLGVQYAFTDALAMRGEWERYRINDAVGNRGDVDMLSVGLVYRFGSGSKGSSQPVESAYVPPAEPVRTQPAQKQEASPEPVRQAAPVEATPIAPAPVAAVAAAPVEAAPAEPLPVIAPVVARTEQYCSILDVQFDINQTTVQREANERIDKVGTFMRKYPETTAVIEGHTDEVGTAANNMKLSERRAQSVVDYLVEKNGIARSRLRAVGYGMTRPIGDNKTQAGRRMNRRIDAIIACAMDIEGIAPVPARITMALEMEFEAASAEVRPQYHDALRRLANFIKTHPGVTATVEGHSSNQQGTPAQAMELSRRRAENVVNVLVNEFGVERSRLSAAGFGGTRRFAYNTDAEGQQENRRVNIILDFPG